MSAERPGPGRNRGPAAAAENRRAILEAARRVFTERGFHVPLSAVAREAGVGQGVLYRHFPNRLDLAFAVFDTHWAEFEEMAADPDPRTFERMWTRLVDLTIEEAAFIEMVVEAGRSLPHYDGAERMRSLLKEPLRRAVDAGLADPRLTVEDVMLGQSMAYGIVATALDSTNLRETVIHALTVSARLPRITSAATGARPAPRGVQDQRE